MTCFPKKEIKIGSKTTTYVTEKTQEHDDYWEGQITTFNSSGEAETRCDFKVESVSLLLEQLG